MKELFINALATCAIKTWYLCIRPTLLSPYTATNVGGVTNGIRKVLLRIMIPIKHFLNNIENYRKRYPDYL